MTQKKEQDPNKKTKCTIMARVVGYYRPIDNWNRGAVKAFKDRKIVMLDGNSFGED